MDTFLSTDFEKLIFEKYIHDLSGSAFKVFLKLIWMSRKSSEIKVRSDRMLRRSFCIYSNSELVWNELINANLVIKKSKRDRSIYILNWKKLKEECNCDCRLRVIVFHVTELATHEVANVDDNVIVKMIKSAKFDNALVPGIFKLIMNLKKYHLDKEKWFLLKDVKRILFILVKYDSRIIHETCERFNRSPKISGVKGMRYFIKMIEGINAEFKQPVVKKTENDENKNKEVDKRKREGELKFAIKIAIGDAENSVIYKRLLSNNESELVRLWNLGVEELKKDGREDEIVKDYEWLKLENEKV